MNFKTITSENLHAEIRMLKCYLANDHRGHFMTTNKAANMPGRYGAAYPVAADSSSIPARTLIHPGSNMTRGQ